jgi:hypothetical protein
MVMTRDRPSRWCGIDPELDYQSPGNPRAGALCDYQALCDGRSIIAAPPIASDATAQVLVPGIDDDLAVMHSLSFRTGSRQFFTHLTDAARQGWANSFTRLAKAMGL